MWRNSASGETRAIRNKKHLSLTPPFSKCLCQLQLCQPRIKINLSPFKQSYCSRKQPACNPTTFYYSLTEPQSLLSFGQGQCIGRKKIEGASNSTCCGKRCQPSNISAHMMRYWNTAVTLCLQNTATLSGIETSRSCLDPAGCSCWGLLGGPRCIPQTLATHLASLHALPLQQEGLMAGWHLAAGRYSHAVSEARVGMLLTASFSTCHMPLLCLCYRPWNNKMPPMWGSAELGGIPQTSGLHLLGLQMQQWKMLGNGGCPGARISGSTSISCRLTWVWGRSGDIHRLANLSAKWFFTLFPIIFPISPKNSVFLLFLQAKVCMQAACKTISGLAARLMQELWAPLRLHSILLCAWPPPRGCGAKKKGLKKPFTIDYVPGENQFVPQTPLWICRAAVRETVIPESTPTVQASRWVWIGLSYVSNRAATFHFSC